MTAIVSDHLQNHSLFEDVFLLLLLCTCGHTFMQNKVKIRIINPCEPNYTELNYLTYSHDLWVVNERMRQVEQTVTD